ncbi:MAG: hypothetical protein JNL98_34010 [Bryobacterales bacterium]|nr:hypothetical protein [Bryobacterales bacterium]
MPNVGSIHKLGPARSAVGRTARSNPTFQNVPEDRMAAAVAHILSDHEPKAAVQAAEILVKAAGPRSQPPDMKRAKEGMEKTMFVAVLEEMVEEVAAMPQFRLESVVGELNRRLDELRNPQSKPNQNLLEAMQQMQILQQSQQVGASVTQAMHGLQMSAIGGTRR